MFDRHEAQVGDIRLAIWNMLTWKRLSRKGSPSRMTFPPGAAGCAKHGEESRTQVKHSENGQ